MKALNETMEFDHIVTVHQDGAVTDGPANLYAPECRIDVDAEGSITPTGESDLVESLRSAGWELMSGYTGQHGYRGPIMHSSEYIGGRLEEDILETPGHYVAMVVECDYPEDVPEDDRSEEPAGWLVAYRAN